MTRRSDVADAAIETLAAAGMRGLTHRAVDQAAGLPEGSTSYYFRTRQALLQAVVERLAELIITAEIPALPVTDLDAAAAAITATIQLGATTGRSRHLARYELILEAVRRPELRAALTASWAVVQEAVAQQLAALGLADAHRRAVDLLALVDGLLFDAIAGTVDRDLTSAGLQATVRALLTAVTSPDPERGA